MITATQIADLLDGLDVTEAGRERYTRLAATAGVVLIWHRPCAESAEILVTGALDGLHPHAASAPLLINRAGPLLLPTYGDGPTHAHLESMQASGLAVQVLANGPTAYPPCWQVGMRGQAAGFTLTRDGVAYCEGLAVDLSSLPAPNDADRFQARTVAWVRDTFGAEQFADMQERGDRFAEEALEFLQSIGYSRESVLRAVQYVYERGHGEPLQEAGGVLLTMAPICEVLGFDILHAGEVELARVQTEVRAIRAKQARKPAFNAAPAPAPLKVVNG